MSEKNQSEKHVRGEEPELVDEALEQVAGGCQMGDSKTGGGDDGGTLDIRTLLNLPTL